MDNTNDQTRVNSQPVSSSQPVTQSSSVGLAQKEQPSISSRAESEASKIISVSEKEPLVPKEVRDAGVEQVSDRLPLTRDHQALGIEHAKESTPVNTQPLGMVKLPMSEEEALETIKITSDTDSRHWLAVLIRKIYEAIKGLKVVS